MLTTQTEHQKPVSTEGRCREGGEGRSLLLLSIFPITPKWTHSICMSLGTANRSLPIVSSVPTGTQGTRVKIKGSFSSSVCCCLPEQCGMATQPLQTRVSRTEKWQGMSTIGSSLLIGYSEPETKKSSAAIQLRGCGQMQRRKKKELRNSLKIGCGEHTVVLASLCSPPPLFTCNQKEGKVYHS